MCMYMNINFFLLWPTTRVAFLDESVSKGWARARVQLQAHKTLLPLAK